jgi:2-dehydro-3-deoxygluconokinase
MTDNSLGHSIVNGIRAYGVDTSHVVWTKEDRVGLYFYEAGKAPRGGTVIYDRANSAISKMQPAELPQNLFRANQAKLLHLSGITLAIGENAAQTTYEAAKLAKKAGFLLSFDINYRSLLWSPEEAVRACHELASMADILFLPLRDALSLYHTSENPHDAVIAVSQNYPLASIVMTLGAKGAIARETGDIIQQDAFSAEEIGRLGGGDAFVAGFLYAYLKSSNLANALRWGAATAAYKYSVAGDLPLIDKDRISRMVNDEQLAGLLR